MQAQSLRRKAKSRQECGEVPGFGNQFANKISAIKKDSGGTSARGQDHAEERGAGSFAELDRMAIDSAKVPL
jgi:hypothetical protein